MGIYPIDLSYYFPVHNKRCSHVLILKTTFQSVVPLGILVVSVFNFSIHKLESLHICSYFKSYLRSLKCHTKMTWFFSYDKIIDLQSIKNNSQIMNGKPLNGMLIPTKNLNYNTRNTDKIALFYTKHNFFQKKNKIIQCYWMEKARP